MGRRKNERASKKKRASKKRERAAKKTTKVALEKKNKEKNRKKRERRNKHLHRKRLTAKKAKRLHVKINAIISYGTKGKRAQVDGRVLGLKHGFKVLKKISTPAHAFFKALVKAQMAENKKKARAVQFTKADFEALKNWKGN